MTWATLRAPRVPRHVLDAVTGELIELIAASRELLIDHARHHVEQNNGEIECPLCIRAHEAVGMAQEGVRALW